MRQQVWLMINVKPLRTELGTLSEEDWSSTSLPLLVLRKEMLQWQMEIRPSLLSSLLLGSLSSIGSGLVTVDDHYTPRRRRRRAAAAWANTHVHECARKMFPRN